jgi:dephospho-CoA kinase
MIKVGLTGGIGTGKTVVAEIFAALGIPIFFADQEAKKAYTDEEILKKIRQLFGESVFDDHGLNFIKLSNHIFSHKIELEKLNNIIHPYVLARFEKWIGENLGAPYVMMESAILFETGYNSMFEKMITVTAPLELCIERVMKRDGIDRDMVLKRILNQFPNESKVEKSDYSILNDNLELLSPQVIKIHTMLSAIDK